MQQPEWYKAGNSEVSTNQYWRNSCTTVLFVLGGKFDIVGSCVLAEITVPLYNQCSHKWQQPSKVVTQ
eukprot:3579604-Rhodomonas_salina.2